MSRPTLAAALLATTAAVAFLLPIPATAQEPAPSAPQPDASASLISDQPLPNLGPLRPDSDFAPVDRPGPALSVPQSSLDQALTCTGNAGLSGRQTVLFVPGTTLTPHDNFAWNWFRALDEQNRPYCSVTLPDNAMNDTQTASEYVVNAIREVHARSGEKVQIVGFSQGGTEPRFALRFWPDLRDKVDDVVALGTTNHGSVLVDAMCVTSCAEALQQQRLNSQYTQAMNSYQETFAGISYTQIYTHLDEFVQPNTNDQGTTSLHTGDGDITNVAVQDVCPAHVAEHLALGTYDPVAHALADDALRHAGPADPNRISPGVCVKPFQPGVNPVTFATDFAATDAVIVRELALQSRVASEPPLRPYTLAAG